MVALITSAVVGLGAVAIAGDFHFGTGYTVATIGAEAVPSAAANDEPDIVTQWKAKSPGNERASFFKANAAAIKAALGM